MTTDAQKSGERAAVELIFPPTEFELVDSEAPDFRVRGSSAEFGVEVTELYDSGSAARLANVPDYIPNLLAGVAPIHKDDAHLAPRDVVVVSGIDGTRRTIPAVMSRVPSVVAFERLLADAVLRKSARGYASDLAFHDLVVADKTPSLSLIEHREVVGALVRSILTEALAASSFREVFLLTRCKEHRAIVVPLKAMLLMREFLLFMHGCKTLAAEGRMLPSAPSHEVLSGYLGRRGVSLGLFEQPDRQFLVYGSLSLLVSDGQAPDFGVHADHVLPVKEIVVTEETRAKYEPVFQEIEAWAATRTIPLEPRVLPCSDADLRDTSGSTD